MNREWNVTVVDRGRECLQLRARNRVTGRVTEKASTTTKRREAEREGATWAAELNEHGKIDDLKFSEAFERFETEYAIHRRPGTQQLFRNISTMFQRLVGDPKLSAINEGMIAEFSRQYAAKGRAVASLASNLRHLKVFLRWSHRQKLMPRLPYIEMPRMANKAGGRPLTGEEVDRLLEKLVVVRPDDAACWQHLVRGLWCSGLRLGEALALSWDEAEPVAVVGIDTERPSIRIEGTHQKSGKLSEIPCVPEMVELLRAVSKAERQGKVFKLPTTRIDNASKVISAAGKKAKIVTGTNATATAHDLRRAFAARWARKLSAQALKQLMRHASLQTTLTFYATGDVGLSDAIWGVSGDKTGDKPLPANASKGQEMANSSQNSQ